MSNPPGTIRRDTRVLISAATRELGGAQARHEGARGQRLPRRRAGQLPARLPIAAVKPLALAMAI